ncbi:MAG: hypothetical protein AB8U44_03545 [Aaplasma endosymbiont of Hyalomma asiaticum]
MLPRLVVTCCALLALSGCFSYVQQSGYPGSRVRLWDSVREGMSRDELIGMIGYPVIEDGDSWVYPSCALTRIAASVVSKYSCEVLRISFDGAGNVSDVVRASVPSGNLRSVSGPEIKVTGIHDGVWRKIEGSFGGK